MGICLANVAGGFGMVEYGGSWIKMGLVRWWQVGSREGVWHRDAKGFVKYFYKFRFKPEPEPLQPSLWGSGFWFNNPLDWTLKSRFRFSQKVPKPKLDQTVASLNDCVWSLLPVSVGSPILARITYFIIWWQLFIIKYLTIRDWNYNCQKIFTSGSFISLHILFWFFLSYFTSQYYLLLYYLVYCP